VRPDGHDGIAVAVGVGIELLVGVRVAIGNGGVGVSGSVVGTRRAAKRKMSVKGTWSRHG
jgi:hypothetical protein